ncbi:MAG TPA: DEDD exonuclease domain-containing protein [Acidimicrobiia bacterium]|nr:DEDD exonuclease domain-containing protein [Acidimicrobiia bacterium]
MTLLGQRSFSDMGVSLADVPFCVLDLETTGVAPDTCAITEIGAIRYEGGIETGRFHTLVNPRSPIPPTVTVITGITQAMVIAAPTIEEVLPSFLEFLSDAVVVGHNVRFDVSFLNAASLRLGYGRLPNRSADTLRLARRLLGSEVRSLRLSSLAAHLGSPISPNHRAFDDAQATAHVFWALLERAGSIGVTHLDDLLALPTIKGARAIGKLSLTEHLPRRPGVYIFRDRTGAAIYVGKATNLRARVRSYFAGDQRRRVDAMLRDLHRIDHLTTATEIEAAVIELRLIASEAPRYNRRSKDPRSLHWVTLTRERHPRLAITRSPSRGIAYLGPLRTRRQAESVIHTLWDASMIRRCTRAGAGCQYAQLGVAMCPHDDATTDTQYAVVVDELCAGLTHPATLLDAVRRRLVALVEHGRFEEAARCRDGWGTLARTLERSRIQQALIDAGTIVAKAGTATIHIEQGRLVPAQMSESTASWVTSPEDGCLWDGDAGSIIVRGDEAVLLWKWLMASGTELVSVTGSLATPVHPIPLLDRLESAVSPSFVAVSV